MTSQASDPPRVRQLGAALADQIAAGEVVERPASVIKELVDNAIDAGARRIDVRLVDAGVTSIAVSDDGHGIHPDDLTLALSRHATSKLTRVQDLTEIDTLGFRGEALASVAAIARVTIRSRRQGHEVGRVVHCRPGGITRVEPAAMAVGTRVQVDDFFHNVPARRKFLRSEATEVGHAVEAVVRLAVVHPDVRFCLTHGRRTLLELSAAPLAARVEAVLARRGGTPPIRAWEGERDGVAVRAWLAAPASTARRGRSVMVVVRRRVVTEPNLAKIVVAAYGEALGPGCHPIACLWVDPPRGDVDVNVHPQKSEVRLGDPQRVYAAVRTVLAAPPTQGPAWGAAPEDRDEDRDEDRSDPARASLAAALSPEAPWAQRAEFGRPARPGTADGGGHGSGYRLQTRATASDYAQTRTHMQQQAQQLGAAIGRARTVGHAADAERSAPASPPEAEGPAYLGVLPGPVGLFRDGADLLAVDLKALRVHLVYERFKDDLGGEGIGAQGLLQPAVVAVGAADVALIGVRGDALVPLGLVVEPFGAEAVVVRAVPAQLRRCVDALDIADLVHRALAWLRMTTSPTDAVDPEAAMRSFAAAAGPDPAPRLARAWMRELITSGADLASIDGVQRWTTAALVRGPRR